MRFDLIVVRHPSHPLSVVKASMLDEAEEGR